MPCSVYRRHSTAQHSAYAPVGTQSGLYRYLPHHRPSNPSIPISAQSHFHRRAKPEPEERKKKAVAFSLSRWPPALRCRYRRPGPFPKLRSHKTPGPGSWFWFLWKDLRCSASTRLFLFSFLSAPTCNKKEQSRRYSSSCCHGVVRDLKDASAARGRWW